MRIGHLSLFLISSLFSALTSYVRTVVKGRQMVENMASDLGVGTDRINVKATTEEGLGFTGQLLGMACHAVCLLEEA